MAKIIISFVCGVIVCLLVLKFTTRPENDTESKDKIHEERINSLNDSLEIAKTENDSLLSLSIVLEERIKNQGGNIESIKRKHEKNRNNIFALSADASIIILSNNLSKKDSI